MFNYFIFVEPLKQDSYGQEKLPIGISDYKLLVSEDYYYVDKTDFIRQVIEEGSLITLFPVRAVSVRRSIFPHYAISSRKQKVTYIVRSLKGKASNSGKISINTRDNIP